MSDTASLDSAVDVCFFDALSGVETINDAADIEVIIEAARDQAADAADNAVIYHSVAAEIIRRHEMDPDAADADEYCFGETFRAADWQAAQSAYAFAVALSVIHARVFAAGKRLGEAYDALKSEAHAIAGGVDIGTCTVSASCIHGWAPHASETPDGVMIWQPAELEGCHAVSVNAGVAWLTYTWAA